MRKSIFSDESVFFAETSKIIQFISSKFVYLFANPIMVLPGIYNLLITTINETDKKQHEMEERLK